MKGTFHSLGIRHFPYNEVLVVALKWLIIVTALIMNYKGTTQSAPV